MMPSFVYQILSLTIIILSLVQTDGFETTTGNAAPSLMDPVASLDESGGPALGLLGTSGDADVSGTIPDANSVIAAQAVVASPDAHGCSKSRKRRRGDERFCSSTESPPSSQQIKPSNSDGQPSNGAEEQKQENNPESIRIFGPILEHSCPEGLFPICAAPLLIENPLAQGTYSNIPWVGHNIPPTIDIEEDSRFCTSI